MQSLEGLEIFLLVLFVDTDFVILNQGFNPVFFHSHRPGDEGWFHLTFEASLPAVVSGLGVKIVCFFCGHGEKVGQFLKRGFWRKYL
jgi:hypothetical protein